MNTPFLLLIASAVCEALWNMALKKSSGVYDWTVNIIGVCILIAGIITFKKAINTISLSIAIVIWSGVSLMLTIILDMIFYKTKFDSKTAFFMLLAIISIIGLNYYSSKLT